MTDARRTNLPILQDEQTTVGNYFVSNYPPYSFWSPQHRDEALTAIAQAPEPDTPLGIYIHIPFCRKRCHFCYFRVYTDRNADDIHRYMDAVLAEAAMYARQPCIGGRKPRFIYFGGGTPSYLSAPQLTYLTDKLKKHLPWDEADEVAFECEPGTLNENKLRAIRAMGVTRLSLGVENFDEHILKINNRAHAGKEIYRAYNQARRVGFHPDSGGQINIDLIAGMVDETQENWHRCVEETIRLDPDCVTIYQMEVPYNTTIYQEMQAQGALTAPVADWATKRRWVAEAFAALEGAGYTVSSAYTAVKNPAKTRFVYRDALWNGADMLGLGVSSFGHIGGVHVQNQHNIDPYIEQVEQGDWPIHRALKMTARERLIRQFILQMKLGRLRRDYFIQTFGVDAFGLFDQPLAELAQHGWLELNEQGLTLSRDGLLQVDRLLPSFYLPEHRQVRYA